ncbi:hypothetical protein L1I30_10685 [Gillisia sp. M10.2A]|uniref:Glucosamine inositolphosphorylceramide transferase 1 N-terminal domain-containing protein n=1 Tax=Gillisia lutea TaxID=2909668 RepID=A0ABS9EJU5_9FLAO|nr:hypothetical protein [Gillisia lutea]MCF4102134.1 hypothetical protein [Gillisia lutea]
MRKSCIIFGSIILIILSLSFFNYNYPFITPKVGKWSVGFQKVGHIFPSVIVDSKQLIPYTRLDSILKSEDNYIADPFYIQEAGIYYLFVELKGRENADIALFTSNNGQEYSYQGIVLNESFHLSYPQVFKYKKEYYMLPETNETNQVLLYKAQNFPYNWIIEDTLIKNTRLKDPTILLSKDRNLIIGVDDKLTQFIYEADSLRGKWNEVENYKQGWGNETRPAGRFFRLDENWYLPVQDRSLGYGSGVSIYKLQLKDRLELVKEKSRYLEAQKKIKWFNRGMHHLDIQADGKSYYMVYDGDHNINDEEYFQMKRTFKFNLIDIYNYFSKN